MFVLDTDHVSVLEWESRSEVRRLQLRIRNLARGDVATTVVSYEEQMRGWLAFVARARTLPQQIEAYRRLKQHLDNYRLISVLPFDEEAAAQFQKLQRLRLRIGVMDLRIAAIALANNGVLLSRNLGDFQKVPNLTVEDWTE